jgi:aminoglycoside 3-N-acetyltransferase
VSGAIASRPGHRPRLAAVEQRRQMLEFLRRLELPPNGTLLVHSAFKQLSDAGFEPDPVLDALAEYMEPGTLLLPAMSWRTVTPANPIFDARTTPAITGILSESFRCRLATDRSLHPTHSVSGRGRLAARLLERHHLGLTPCCDDSPFGLLGPHGGQVLLLGVGMESCTLVHHVEERFNPKRYLRPGIETYTCIALDGQAVPVRTQRHARLSRNFWQFEERLAAEGGVRRAHIGAAAAASFAAAAMVAVIAERLAGDPDGTLARPGERFKLM